MRLRPARACNWHGPAAGTGLRLAGLWGWQGMDWARARHGLGLRLGLASSWDETGSCWRERNCAQVASPEEGQAGGAPLACCSAEADAARSTHRHLVPTPQHPCDTCAHAYAQHRTHARNRTCDDLRAASLEAGLAVQGQDGRQRARGVWRPRERRPLPCIPGTAPLAVRRRGAAAAAFVPACRPRNTANQGPTAVVQRHG
jgi:hypothetical protein